MPVLGVPEGVNDNAASWSACLTEYQSKRDFDRAPEPAGSGSRTPDRNRFVLTCPRRGGSNKDQWLLHEREEHARAEWDPEEHPRSVKSGRTNEEVATAPAAEWHGERSHRRPKSPSHRTHRSPRYVAVPGRSARQRPPLPGRRGQLRVLAEGGVEPLPDWLERWRYEHADETHRYVIPDSAAALVWLANYGALELHPWTSRASGPQHPTWLLFDIDPGSHTSFEDVLVLARLHRTVLDRLARVGEPLRAAPRCRTGIAVD